MEWVYIHLFFHKQLGSGPSLKAAYILEVLKSQGFLTVP